MYKLPSARQGLVIWLVGLVVKAPALLIFFKGGISGVTFTGGIVDAIAITLMVELGVIIPQTLLVILIIWSHQLSYGKSASQEEPKRAATAINLLVGAIASSFVLMHFSGLLGLHVYSFEAAFVGTVLLMGASSLVSAPLQVLGILKVN
jgi:hypothetical protein